MSLKAYLIGIGIAAASALAIWVWVLLDVDPLVATRFEFILFFSSFFVWLAGGLTLLSFYLRLIKSKNEYYYGNLVRSLRQSILFSFFLTIAFVLTGYRLVSKAEIALLFLAVLLFELYFSAKKQR